MITLKKPTLSDQTEYYKAHKIMQKEDFDFAFDLNTFESFTEYLKRNQELEKGINLKHMVPASFLGILQ